MELRNKLIIKTLIGCVTGMLISVIMILATATDVIETGSFLLHTIGGGIYGAIAMGGSITYDIESWSILRATITHYITTFAAFVIASLSLGWFSLWLTLFVWLGMSVIYAMVWLIEYFAWKRSIQKINESLSAICDQDKNVG